MTSSEAIREYSSVSRYVKILRKLGPPYTPVARSMNREDQKVLTRVRDHWQADINSALMIMDQAERAISDLPREEWRTMLQLVYLDGLQVWDAALQAYCSDRSAARYLSQAFDYLENKEGQEIKGGLQEARKSVL